MAKIVLNQPKENEHKLWENLAEDQKSYAAQLLHYLHYRPLLTLKSWTREELLTWELWRALDVLPKRIFLNRILDACVSTGKNVAIPAKILKNSLLHVIIEPYPNLRLGGRKRFSNSDIGFLLNGTPWLWLEAKTRPIPLPKLARQLAIQREALLKLNSSHSAFVIPLIPDAQILDSGIALRWSMIASILLETIDELKRNPAAELLDGQINIANELYKRIITHDPKLIS